jgi:glycine cleavage system H lipoate-binding protein
MANALSGLFSPPSHKVNSMVALFVLAIVLCAVTADYVVQRLALRALSGALDGFFVDASHLWIQAEPSGLARVGADPVIRALLGRSWKIDWAPKGQVKRGAPLAVVYGQGRSLALRSPVDGEVMEQNPSFASAAMAASNEAFDAGWLVRLRPVELAPRLAAMKTGAKLREWSRQEMDRLRAFVLSRLPLSAVGVTATDGGPLAADLASRLDDDAWKQAVRLVLGTDNQEQDETNDLAVASSGGQS